MTVGLTVLGLTVLVGFALYGLVAWCNDLLKAIAEACKTLRKPTT